MAEDIVTRLREIATEWACPFCEPGPMGECGQCLAMLAAADEIERLRAQVSSVKPAPSWSVDLRVDPDGHAHLSGIGPVGDFGALIAPGDVHAIVCALQVAHALGRYDDDDAYSEIVRYG